MDDLTNFQKKVLTLLYNKLYPLSRTFLKIEILIFRHLSLEDTPYNRHPQMPLTHDFGHFDYGTHCYS